MNKVILTLLVVCSVAFSSSVNAQTVVLINGEPTKVLLEKTTIIDALYDDVSDYLKGFDTNIPVDRSFTIIRKQNEFVFQPIESLYVKENRNLTQFNAIQN